MCDEDHRRRWWPYVYRNGDDDNFLRILVDRFHQLARRVPAVQNVEVQFHSFSKNPDDDTAYVTGGSGQFRIHIEERLGLGTVWDYLIHEFAHVLSWHHQEPNDHGPKWGIAYAKLYREYLRLYDEKYSDDP